MYVYISIFMKKTLILLYFYKINKNSIYRNYRNYCNYYASYLLRISSISIRGTIPVE